MRPQKTIVIGITCHYLFMAEPALVSTCWCVICRNSYFSSFSPYDGATEVHADFKLAETLLRLKMR